MSNTKRFDLNKTYPKWGDGMFMGEVYVDDTPEWKNTRDKKKRGKSPKWFKKMKEQSRRAARKQELEKVRSEKIDIDSLPAVKQPRENDWDWN